MLPSRSRDRQALVGCLLWVVLLSLFLHPPWWVYACLLVLGILLAVHERWSKSDPVAARVLLSAIIVTPGFLSTWYLLDRKSEAMYARAEAEAQSRKRQLEEDQERQRQEAERQQSYEQFRAQVRLPEYLKQMDPREFELLVCKVYARLGYAVRPTPYTGDGGVDGILEKDGVRYVLQCKRLKGSVGRPVLQQLYGAMGDHSATRAVVVTTGNVSRQAKAFAGNKPIEIVELDQLRSLVDQAYPASEIVPADFQGEGMGFPGGVDTCPRCGLPLRTVKGRRGPFIGCTGYPACRYTRAR